MSVKMHRVMCFIVTALLVLLQITCQNNVEVQFLCRNEECSEPIGEFMVKLTYRSDSPEKLSVKARETGVILARPKDRSTHLWRVKINDRIGFVPGNSIQEMKKWEANTTVKLIIPTSSVPSDSNKNAGERNELNDLTADLNTSVTHTEEIRNESATFVADDSSNEKNSADVNKDSEPAPKTDSTEDQASVLPKDESTKEDAKVDKPENESLESKQPPATEDEQIETLGLKKEPVVVPDVLVKLENTSPETNESEVVNIIKESEYISENSTDAILDPAENLTQEILVEKENIEVRVENVSDVASKVENVLVGEISNTSESTSSTVEIQKDAASEIDVKNTRQENLLAENSTGSNISPETETSNNSSENIQQNSDKTEKDQVISPPVEVQVTAEANVESNLSTPNDTSLNSSAPTEIFNNSSAETEKIPDDVEPELAPSTSHNVTSNETSPESVHKLPSVAPTMRMFPDDKEPLIASEQPVTSSEEIITAELDNQNITSEEMNATSDFEPNVIVGNQQHDSVPKEIPYDAYPPQYTETTTELGDNKIPVYTEESSDSNESIPIESPVTPSSSVAEETPLSKLSEPYKYLKSSPYPGMLPNIAIENQPSVTEQNDPVSSQEIIETEPETGSDSAYQSSESIPSEPAAAPVETEQKQGLNDFIHSSRIKTAEPIDKLETTEEKSIYETVGEYFPDFSLLSAKLTNLFDFGSSAPEETPNSEVCTAEEFCGTDRLNSHMDKPENPESETIFEVPFLGVVNKEQVTYISGILTSAFIATILLWWLMNYFNRSKKTTLLIQRINQLENKLLISTREIATLQDQLVEQDSQAESRQNAADVRRVTESFEHKINQYKKRIVELDDKVIYLEKELENVSNSALEMHKLLENSLATQAQSKSALDEVETLRTLAENQEHQIDELQKEINAVVTENECLKVDNEMNKSTIKKLEKECNAQTKKNVELSEKNRSLTLLLDKELESNTVLESNYKSELYDLRSKLEDVEMNFKRSEFQVQELQRAILDKQDSVQGSGNDVQLKVQISTLEAMNKELSGQLNEQKNARRMLEDHVGDITKELNNLKKSFENSEKEKNQAVTKLQVLTQYFKDKEEQLHKELEAKDKLSLERESKDQSLSQKLSLMREEISNLKIQNEELRKEVLDQEASYKVQLANAEQKTREHWFALRQAERKYKESQQEAAILRNKILVLETNMSSISLKTDDKNNSALNGDIPGSSSILYHPSLSPDLLPYPSPSDFIPPPPSPIPSHSPDFFPPEPIYSPDERLPPLGGRRGPSPPPPISPEDDFSPPPPVMKYPPNRSHNVEPPVPGGYSRRTPPPSGRHRSQYKSRPPRSSIDSPSSGMSLESLDKSGR